METQIHLYPGQNPHAMSQSPLKNPKNPTQPPTQPKYSDQPFSAWKAYLDDGEEPDTEFIDWKKNVLGDSSQSIKSRYTEPQRVIQNAKDGHVGENKAVCDNKAKSEGKIDVKQKQKDTAVLSGRDSNRIV